MTQRINGYDRILAPIEKKLELPFKPFTLDEVAQITKAISTNIDTWSRFIGMRHGLGVTGLEWCQVFAIFVGQKYLDEGASLDRATAVVRFLAEVKPPVLEAQLSKGNTFPVPRCLADPGCAHNLGKFIPCPDV